ncbi:MAG: hypothetical protein IPK53_12140 [bacterium]|nr:hypothetical protein [bacterium]
MLRDIMVEKAVSDTQNALWLSFRNFANDVLKMLSSGAELPHIEKKHRIVFEGKRYRQADTLIPSYGRIFRSREKLIVGLPSAIDCARVHLDQGIFTIGKRPDWFEELGWGKDLPAPTREQYYPAIAQRLLFPIMAAVDTSESLEPPERQLRSCYERFISMVQKQPYPRVFIAPLPGFVSDIKLIRVCEDWEIVRFSDSVKTLLWSGTGSLWQPYEGVISLSEFQSATHCFRAIGKVLECKAIVNTSYLWNKSEAHRIVTDLSRMVTALRLTKEEHVGAPCIISVPSELQRITSMQWQNPGLRATNWQRKPYNLANDDLQELTDVYLMLHKAEQHEGHTPFAVALNKFNSAYARSQAADQVLDLVIAIEGLLSHGQKYNVKKRLASRGPKLLEHIIDPDQIRPILETMYLVRCKLVHEGLPLPDAIASVESGLEDDIQTFMDNCFTVARWVLGAYLPWFAEGWSVEDMNATPQ